MSDGESRVFRAERSGRLESGFRRWTQNPRRILKPFVKEGMTVVDMGCGPGFFTLPMAGMVGAAGRVIAVDLQEEMLRKLRGRIEGTDLGDRVTLKRCKAGSIGVPGPVDFVLLFYVVHEVPSPEELLRETASILVPGGRALLVEPDFRVTRQEFGKTVETAKGAGLTVSRGPWILFSRSAVLERTSG